MSTTLMPAQLQRTLALSILWLVCRPAWGDEEPICWQPNMAAQYLDERANAWFMFSSARRGEGLTETTCVSCHTALPYALARPALRKLTGAETPTEEEKKLLDQTRLRVENWKRLDTAAWGLLYDSSDAKKRESWGTEAVLNAVVLAFDDRYRERSLPSEATQQALANLWQTQLQTGEHSGAWDWLDFSLGPWECAEARYFGAALAAVAVGSAPGYYTPGGNLETDARVTLLREYLKAGLPRQQLHNQVWGLWAAAKIAGLLTNAQQNHVIERLLEKQQDDGGWSLPSLGTWVRGDGTTRETSSDGYATGLIVHVLQEAGVSKDDAIVAKGLNWLRHNQMANGLWRSVSVNKAHDPGTLQDKFMSDAATAYAVLALSH